MKRKTISQLDIARRRRQRTKAIAKIKDELQEIRFACAPKRDEKRRAMTDEEAARTKELNDLLKDIPTVEPVLALVRDTANKMRKQYPDLAGIRTRNDPITGDIIVEVMDK